MARIMIVGGGCRGRRLAAALVERGDAVRVSTRDESGRAAIEAAGAECWIGDPDRLATLRGSLDGVAVACWLLATAEGTEQQLRALHGTRLELFLTQAIDSTVRGFVYEACAGGRPPAAGERRGSVPGAGESAPQPHARGRRLAEVLAEGERRAGALAARNAIPFASLHADPADTDAWLGDARRAIDALLV